jgi:hypothetical protein
MTSAPVGIADLPPVPPTISRLAVDPDHPTRLAVAEPLGDQLHVSLLLLRLDPARRRPSPASHPNLQKRVGVATSAGFRPSAATQRAGVCWLDRGRSTARLTPPAARAGEADVWAVDHGGDPSVSAARTPPLMLPFQNQQRRRLGSGCDRRLFDLTPSRMHCLARVGARLAVLVGTRGTEPHERGRRGRSAVRRPLGCSGHAYSDLLGGVPSGVIGRSRARGVWRRARR